MNVTKFTLWMYKIDAYPKVPNVLMRIAMSLPVCRQLKVVILVLKVA